MNTKTYNRFPIAEAAQFFSRQTSFSYQYQLNRQVLGLKRNHEVKSVPVVTLPEVAKLEV